MMYKSQFLKINPYEWLCGPGSQINIPTDSLPSKKNCITQKKTKKNLLINSY